MCVTTTCATTSPPRIASGCSDKAVQEVLGHASAKETLDTYAHLWPSDTDRIRAAVDGTLRHLEGAVAGALSE